MGTIATHIVAIGPEQFIVDLYAAWRVLVTTFRWARKRMQLKVNDLHLGVRIGDGIQVSITYDADPKGEANTSASPNPVLSADAEEPRLHASKKGEQKSKVKRKGRK